MAVVHVNDRSVDIGDEKLNLIQAAKKGGVFIPHYCWHPALSVVASCRMCLVEVGERKPDGTSVMQPKVVPACQTPAKDGTVIITNSEKAKNAQGQTLESLLLNHPLDCPVCDKAGECLLQDFSYRFGRSESRMIDEKNTPPNKPYISPTITLFTDRCILCSRCVRFTREISGTAELQVINRGHHSEIDVFPGEPLDNKLAGNVVDICPVGALGSKDFLYKQRVWLLRSQKSVCPDCSTGCSIEVDHNKDIIYRLRPRENPQAQGHFICDEGRYGYHYVNARERISEPSTRGRGTSNGRPIRYEEVIEQIRTGFRSAGDSIAAVLSPFLTCEEAYLLARFIKACSPSATLALGPVPIHGQDDAYPKDRRGRPIEPVRFTIRAEKCPNRKGVEAILRHFQGEVIGFEAFLERLQPARFRAIYLTGGYPPRDEPWMTASAAARFLDVPVLVVQDLFASAVSEIATYVLPAAAFTEKDGTFVNHAGLAQAIRPAARPPKYFRTDGQVFLDVLERPGLCHAATLRAEIAGEIPLFAALAGGNIPDHGVFLDGLRSSGPSPVGGSR